MKLEIPKEHNVCVMCGQNQYINGEVTLDDPEQLRIAYNFSQSTITDLKDELRRTKAFLSDAKEVADHYEKKTSDLKAELAVKDSELEKIKKTEHKNTSLLLKMCTDFEQACQISRRMCIDELRGYVFEALKIARQNGLHDAIKNLKATSAITKPKCKTCKIRVSEISNIKTKLEMNVFNDFDRIHFENRIKDLEQPCPSCKPVCEMCGGSGEVSSQTQEQIDEHGHQMPCPSCKQGTPAVKPGSRK